MGLGSRGQKGTGSRIRIRNTDCSNEIIFLEFFIDQSLRDGPYVMLIMTPVGQVLSTP
jgi:hypothetical protein